MVTPMSFNQRRQGRLFRVSWGACLLLSVLAHLFLLAGTYLVPEEWLASPRPAEVRRQVVVTAPHGEEGGAGEEGQQAGSAGTAAFHGENQ